MTDAGEGNVQHEVRDAAILKGTNASCAMTNTLSAYFPELQLNHVFLSSHAPEMVLCLLALTLRSLI
jgi:hypothetical protein